MKNNGIILGIDIGTSGCKVLAVNTKAEILHDVIETYPCHFPKAGWSEQNPIDWWEAVSKGVRRVLDALKGEEVLCVGLSGQMHGMVALDKDNNVIRPAILWNDQRTTAQCDEITAAAGGLDSLLSYTDNPMITGFTGGKILWMKQNEPQNYEKTVCILNPKDYIRFMLTGEHLTEVSDASGTGLYDVKNRCFSYELIEKVGLSASLFPQVCESTDVAGHVNEAASQKTGLPVGCPVSGGGGDAVISTVGLGLVVPSRVGITVGTSGVVAMGLPDFIENPKGMIQVSCANDPGKWHAMACILSAAGAFEWFDNVFGDFERANEESTGVKSYRALDNLAENVPAGSDGVFFLPYLTGERCPVYDAKAKGAFFGIDSTKGKGHFVRAVLEGVAYATRQCYDIIRAGCPVESNELVLAGGGANSPLWRQIFADVFGLPVRTVYGSAQGGSFGAALVAGVTAGVFENLEQAVLNIKTETETLPKPENTAVYNEMYKKYCGLYDSVKWMWQE